VRFNSLLWRQAHWPAFWEGKMKKICICFLIIFTFSIIAYSYEPAHPSYYFEDYINQIQNILNNNFEVTGNKSDYVIIEYSGDDSNNLDINNENIKRIYLIGNQEIIILSQDKRQNYKIIKKLINRKGDYLHIPVIYFKTCENNIYIALEEYNALVQYKVELDLIKNDKIEITNIPEFFDNYEYFKTGLRVYSKWYK